MNEIFILDILIALGAIGYTAHLIYARHNPGATESKIKKYKDSPRAYDLYRKIYSPQFLIITMITAVSFILRLAIDTFGVITGSISLEAKIADLAIEMVLGIVIFYCLYLLFWKKK